MGSQVRQTAGQTQAQTVWSYLLRRVLAGILVLLVLSFGMFVLVALSGDPLAAAAGDPGRLARDDHGSRGAVAP